MSGPHVPFAWVAGRPHLIVNYELEPTGELPSLLDLLKGLLAHTNPADILLLRPLAPLETRLLRASTAAATVEAWAQMVVKPEDRFKRRADKKRARRRRSR